MSGGWWSMANAPKNGQLIRVLVKGYDGKKVVGKWEHEFPYDVIWLDGRWCFARNQAPLFPWQEPRRWRPANE